jgi:hypothetical protein
MMPGSFVGMFVHMSVMSNEASVVDSGVGMV